jgi:subtilisin family serine protease
MGDPPGLHHPEYVPGELLIKFKPGVLHLAKQAFHAGIGARHVGGLSHIRIQRVRIPITTMSMQEAIQYYRNNPDVEYVEPNYVVWITATPNDPQFNQLWGMNNNGQTGGTTDADIDAPEAWDIQTGSSNTVIAVIDTGVVRNHEDLNGNIWTNNVELNGNPGVDDDGNGYVDDVNGWDFLGADNDPTDYNGHGTHVAGTIAGRGNNGIGVTGVNWTASIMPLRCMGPQGFGDTLKASEAIVYAADNGANVINASWGGPGFSQTLYDAISYANQKGCLFVAAAGNGGFDLVGDNNDQIPFYPSSFSLPNIIAVAATDHNDGLASFSNYGITSVDVAAPGVNIRSSIPSITMGGEIQVFSDDFESGLANWTHWGANDMWDLTEAVSVSPTHSLADSPAGDSLDGTGSKIPTFNKKFNLVDKQSTLECRVRYALGAGDFLLIGGTIDGAFNTVDMVAGSSGGGFQSLTTDVSLIGEFTHETEIGFNVLSDGSITDDGVYIDDVTLKTRDFLIGGDTYSSANGTSMAAPHVAGLAALIWAEEPGLTHSEVKERILNGAEGKASLKGRMVTGGRINAYLSLQNEPASPSNLSATAAPGNQINLSWSDNSYGESSFKIERKEGVGGTYGQIDQVATDTTSYNDTGLTTGTVYYYRIRASNGVNDSAYSNEAWATASVTIQTIPASSGGGGGGGCFVTTAIHP